MTKKPEAKTKKKLAKPSEIKAGSLREHVKQGNFKPGDVLAWLHQQPYVSQDFAGWLGRKK